MRGRVAIFESVGQPLVLQDVMVPLPAAGELVARIELSTICGSDVHTVLGRRSASGPLVLGHEMVGRVIALGDVVCDAEGRQISVNDRITWSIGTRCGNCFYCHHELAQKCVELMKYGHAPMTPEYPCLGGLGTYCQLLRGTTIVRVPGEIPDEAASSLNCATATIMAAVRRLPRLDHAVVLIFGAGLLGITAAAYARLAGAEDVIVVDPNPIRLRRLEAFGVTAMVKDAHEARAVLEARTQGRGADVAIECCGQPQAGKAAVELLRMGGTAVLVGAVFPSEPMSLAAEYLVRRCLTVVGVHNYGPEDLVQAVRFMEQAHTRFPFASLVDAIYDLDDVTAAMEHAVRGEAIRVGVRDPRIDELGS